MLYRIVRNPACSTFKGPSEHPLQIEGVYQFFLSLLTAHDVVRWMSTPWGRSSTWQRFRPVESVVIPEPVFTPDLRQQIGPRTELLGLVETQVRELPVDRPLRLGVPFTHREKFDGFVVFFLELLDSAGTIHPQGLRTTFPWGFWGFHGKYSIII